MEDTPIEKAGEDELEDVSIGQNVADELDTISEIPSEPASPLIESVIATEKVAKEEDADEQQEEEGKISTTEETLKNSQQKEDTYEGVLQQTDIKENKDNGLKWFMIALACVLLACAGIVFYLYYPDLQEESIPVSSEGEYTYSTVYNGFTAGFYPGRLFQKNRRYTSNSTTDYCRGKSSFKTASGEKSCS